jgi:xylulokinase
MILTFDLGTTAVKACLFDAALSLRFSATVEYQLLTGEDARVEFVADDYWVGMKACLGLLASLAPEALAEVEGVGITTQGETLVAVDRQGQALRNALVWLDGRAVQEAKTIRSLFDEKVFYSKTGIPDCNGLCPVSKLLWIKNHEPEVYRRTYKFLLLEDYVILRLTGRFVTEKSLLSTTGYFNIAEDGLWNEVLDAVGLDAGKIPEILECGTVVGPLAPGIADELGLPPTTTVVTGAMDQTAGAVGARNLQPGIMSETTGTALTLAVTTAHPDLFHPSRLSVYRHAFAGSYLYLPVCMTAGIVLKGFKDEYAADLVAQAENEGRSVYDVLGDLADGVPLGSGGLVLVPYWAGVTQPDNNPAARGVVLGLSLDTKRGHVIRAIFEGVACMLRENLEIVEAITGGRVDSIRSLGGGSRSALWCQIKADVTDREITTMAEPECASLGVAALVAVALGRFASLAQAVGAANAVALVYRPDPAAVATYEPQYRKYRQLYLRVRDLFDGVET